MSKRKLVHTDMKECDVCLELNRKDQKKCWACGARFVAKNKPVYERYEQSSIIEELA